MVMLAEEAPEGFLSPRSHRTFTSPIAGPKRKPIFSLPALDAEETIKKSSQIQQEFFSAGEVGCSSCGRFFLHREELNAHRFVPCVPRGRKRASLTPHSSNPIIKKDEDAPYVEDDEAELQDEQDATLNSSATINPKIVKNEEQFNVCNYISLENSFHFPPSRNG